MSDTGKAVTVEQGMARLKELLFDSEAETLSELDKRLSSVETANRQIFDRAGTEEKFRTNVANVLDKALQEAELRNHEALSAALAPLVVKMIRSELRNSQDDLVEIMFPITGRMVKSYVASAIKDLSNKINNRIDHNPVMLRVRSLVSGKPVSDLVIAESQRLAVDEVFLIRRASGELVAHWPTTTTKLSNADIHMSGVLAAINDFASGAFTDDGGSFRSFEYDEFEVFMRASPVYLLAAKCNGIAPSGIETIFDEEFLATIERIAQIEKAGSADSATMKTANRGLELHPLASAVESRTSEIYEANEKTRLGGTVVKWMLFLIAVPLFAWLFWWLYTSAEREIVRRTAHSVLASVSEFNGYPATIDVGYRGKSMVVTALAPDRATLNTFTTALGRELPNTSIESRIAVIPVSNLDTKPIEDRFNQRIATQLDQRTRAIETEFTVAAARRALDRANVRLRQALPAIDRLGASKRETVRLGSLEQTRRSVTKAIGDIKILRATLDASASKPQELGDLIDPVNDVSQTVAGIIQALAEMIGADTGAADQVTSPRASVVDAAEDLTSQSERLTTLLIALNQTAAMIPPPLEPKTIVKEVAVPVPAPVPEPSPEEKLRVFFERNAIFFANGVDYASDDGAQRVLGKAARLIKETKRLVRIAGYTDEKGLPNKNDELALRRANKVMDELISRGVSASQLVSVGRSRGYYLSEVVGASSPNRRVQFELGFVGEVRGAQ